VITTVSKPLMVLFLVGGVFATDTVRLAFMQKPNWASPLNLAMLFGGGALLLWNVFMYRKATIVDSEFPKTRVDRYAKPVVASICFVVGAAMALFR